MSDRSRPSLSTKRRRYLFTLHGGLCHICGLAIDTTREEWDVEHVRPRAMFRDPREADTDENMKPAHRTRCHPEKTKSDHRQISKAKKTDDKHHGFKRSRNPLPGGRGSDIKLKVGGGVERRDKRPVKPSLPPRNLFK